MEAWRQGARPERGETGAAVGASAAASLLLHVQELGALLLQMGNMDMVRNMEGCKVHIIIKKCSYQISMKRFLPGHHVAFLH